MKTLLLLTFAVALTLATSMSTQAADSKPGHVYHVVSFKFKPDASPEKIKEVEKAFRDLKKKVPQIISLKAGTNISPEKHDKGFTHGWVLEFATDKDRDAYLVHPDHKEFGKLVGPVLADVFVIDFADKP
jgi:hypothetical protein